MPTALERLQVELRACRRCADAGYFVAPHPIFAGPANAELMIVGQAPGRVEAEETGLPFSGPAGKRLFRWLQQAGWEENDFRLSQYMTAITKCFPGTNAAGRGDRVPSRQEQALCRPWLEQELALVQTRIVVPVGGLAARQFLDRQLKLSQLVGQVFTRPADDDTLTPWARRHLPAVTFLVPLPHPSGASQWFNDPENRRLLEQALGHLARLRR